MRLSLALGCCYALAALATGPDGQLEAQNELSCFRLPQEVFLRCKNDSEDPGQASCFQNKKCYFNLFTPQANDGDYTAMKNEWYVEGNQNRYPPGEAAATTAEPTTATAKPTAKASPTPSPDTAAAADSGDPFSSSGSAKSGGKKSNVGAIVGGIVGGIGALAVLGIAIFLFMRRRRRRGPPALPMAVVDKSRTSSPTSHASPMAHSYQPQHQPQPPPPPPPPPPQQPAHEQHTGTYRQLNPDPTPIAPQLAPAEIQSREVDPDGVSVSSFDMARRDSAQRSVPRLPIYGHGS
ncbi:hypothetical protein EDC01DRAFT_264761 [Geopyxis carbonaria]|nr:hypothetical protein EDC01DRAFT_264761 [Geopyxis carbonaria]